MYDTPRERYVASFVHYIGNMCMILVIPKEGPCKIVKRPNDPYMDSFDDIVITKDTAIDITKLTCILILTENIDRCRYGWRNFGFTDDTCEYYATVA